MVSKPRKVIINLDEKTVIVKTVMRAYQDKTDITENLNVKAASLKISGSVMENVEIPALSLTLIKDGVSLPMKLDNLAPAAELDELPEKGKVVKLDDTKKEARFKSGPAWPAKPVKKKDSASQGHGWPGEDQGRDYGGLTSGGVLEYRKRKRPRSAMDEVEEDDN